MWKEKFNFLMKLMKVWNCVVHTHKDNTMYLFCYNIYFLHNIIIKIHRDNIRILYRYIVTVNFHTHYTLYIYRIVYAIYV